MKINRLKLNDLIGNSIGLEWMHKYLYIHRPLTQPHFPTTADDCWVPVINIIFR